MLEVGDKIIFTPTRTGSPEADNRGFYVGTIHSFPKGDNNRVRLNFAKCYGYDFNWTVFREEVIPLTLVNLTVAYARTPKRHRKFSPVHTLFTDDGRAELCSILSTFAKLVESSAKAKPNTASTKKRATPEAGRNVSDRLRKVAKPKGRRNVAR